MASLNVDEGEVAAIGPGSTFFKKFDDYPWTRDRAFLQGLVAMLGPVKTNGNAADKERALGITLQARIWWYQSHFGVSIDRAAYEAYELFKASSSGTDAAIIAKIEDIQQRMGQGGAPPPSPAQAMGNLPAWQTQAFQKVDLGKKADDGVSGSRPDGGAPYPAHFQAIIEAVTTGKPVPGVREIPNTVVRQEGVYPVGKMKPPLKPWEKAKGVTTPVKPRQNVIDQEFPPV
ncbi:hypothetical protein B0T26DRAFT_727057 [Lasiosphaeria miniovina]|uniref:Uncharacterized protein n=1 Tax=Lasiosphaeria miniovina TaxID=1954250 RepID=A0AA40DKH7_9PEZI|nr:uncharacterized protein B0T26DRAFT_727057 [Lasiosphaeria miniovina]KAK0706550.1 hypothetical protein B0T26DRAFT_727057 [Lasiosphaeria miniovina]